MKRLTSWLRRACAVIQDDSGIVLATVVLISALLFIMATTVLTLVAYRQTQTQHYTYRTQAMHIADAGVNEFLYQLSEDYGYWKNPSNPAVGRTLGPINMDGGTWKVVATAPTNSEPLRITSTGTLANGSKRTINATVRFPTFADYVVLVDEGPYSIGPGATFYGKVRCNGNISNSGVITGLAEAGGTCSAGNSFASNYPGGYKNKVGFVDFTQLTTDMDKMKGVAIASGTYYGVSGVLGYKITLSGSTASIVKVTAVNKKKPYVGTDPPLGKLTTVNVGTVPIPADGVFYFDDDVWVEGNYSAQVTVVSKKNIWCPGNLVPTDTDSNTTCGLVAEEQILFPWWYETMDNNQVVQAATLSQSAGIGPSTTTLQRWDTSYNPDRWVDYTPSSSGYKASITLKGSRAMVSMIGFSAGYDARNFNMDPRLENHPPPLYPMIRDGSLRVDTWLEN